VSIVCDWNGAAIGVGNSAAVAGTVYLSNSSLYTSAASGRPAENTTPLVTANVYQAGQSVNLYEADVAGIPNGAYTVAVDGAAYLTGTMAAYSYTPGQSSVPGNWTSQASGTVGVWLPGGADYLVSGGGAYYKAAWDSTNNIFSVAAVPSVRLGGGGYADLSSALVALNALGTDGVLEVAGSATIGTATIALTSTQAIMRAPSYTGNLLTVGGGDSLTITSGVIYDALPNASIRVNSGGTFTITPSGTAPLGIGGVVYLETGRYITLTAALTSDITVSMANPAVGQVVASIGDFDIADASLSFFAYAGGGHTFTVDASDNIVIAT
jgi:hypothetical protein